MKVRLKNEALGYSLTISATSWMGFSRAIIYGSAQNLLTLSDEGYDPVGNSNSGGATGGNRNLGLDYGSYPNAKSYTVGLNIAF